MTMSLSPRASVIRLAAVLLSLALGHFALSQQPPVAKPPLGDEPLLFDGARTKVLQTTGLRWWAFAISSDGKTLVSCAGPSAAEAGEIHIWDLAKGQIRATIKHTAGVRHVAIAPDNKTLAAGCFDNSLRLYDLESQQLKALGSGHTGAINSVAFTPDGKTLITGGLDNHVKVWTMPSLKENQEKPVEFKPFATLQEHTNWVLSVTVSRDAKTIVSSGNDNLARLWDMPKAAADGKLLEVKKSRRVLRGHSRPVESVAMSRDGSMIATGSWDGEARIWDSASGEEKQRINSNGFGVLSVAFSPDGKELAVGSGNSGNPGQVRRIDLSDGNPEQYLGGHANAVWCVRYSDDGKTLITLSEDRAMIVHSLADPKPQRQLKAIANSPEAPQIVLAAAWSPDGTRLAVAGENKGIVIHEVAGKKTRSWMAHDDVVSSLAWAPDGKTLISGSYDATVKIWDVASPVPDNAKPPCLTLKGHTNWVFALAISPDGGKLASAGYDKSIRIWDLSKASNAWPSRWHFIVRQSGELPVTVIPGQGKGYPDGNSAGVRSLVFTGDGQTLISAGADRVIRFWDVTSGKFRGEASGHKSAIRGLALALDGTTLASGSEDMLVKLWKLKREPDGKYSAAETHELKGHQDLVSSLAFSPRGRTLAVGLFNGVIHLWDPELGRQRTVLGGHTDAVAVVAFAPDGRTLASGSYDKSVRLWPAGQPPQAAMVEYSKHPTAVGTVALSPDGKWTITGDQKGTLRIFERGGTVMQREIQGSHAGGVTGLAWSPDSKLFVSVGRDKVGRIWSAAGEKQRDLSGHTDELLCASWSADGNLIATAGKDKIVAIWDAKTGKNVKKLPGHTGTIQALGFSPDNKLLASAGADKTFRLLETESWKVRREAITNPNNGEYMALAFSPDSRTLALAHNQEQIITPDGTLEQQQFRSVALIDTANGLPKTSTQNFFAHGDWVTGVAFSADGQSLITTSRDMFVRVWSINNNQVVRQFRGHDAGITALAVDPMNDVMATAGDDRAARLWAAAFRRESPRATIAGQTGQVWFAEFSKDGSMLATGGDDKIVRLRTGIAGSQPFTFAPPFGPCFSLATSPDGSMIASGHNDGSIILWDAAGGKRLKTLSGHTTQVWSLTFLADGKRLVSSAGDWNRRAEQPGDAKLWDIAKATVIRDFAGQTGAIYAAIPSPDGKTLATASHDKTIRIWELETGKLRHTLKGHGGAVRTVEFLDEGRMLVSGSHEESTFVFWDLKEGKEKSRQVLPNSNSHINRLRLSPNGKTLAIAVNTPPQPQMAYATPVDVQGTMMRQPTPQQIGNLLLWDVAGHKIKGQSANANRVLDAAFSPDGEVIVTVGGLYAERGEINLWQAADGKKIGELHGHDRWLEAVAITKDGRLISGGGIVRAVQQSAYGAVAPPLPVGAPGRSAGLEPGQLRIWNMASLRPTLELKGHTSHVACGAFSPDGGMLATGGGDKTVMVWDLGVAKKSGKVDHRVLKHDHQLRAVRFSPDGKLLVSSDEGGYVKFWNPVTGENIRTIQAHTISVYGLAFSPDGSTLVTSAGNWRAKAKGEVKFWNAATGQPAGELPQHPSEVWAAAYSPDGKFLATACGDAQVRVYELANKKLVRTLTSPAGLRTVAWSPDGTTLATGNGVDNDPTARLWDATSGMERATLQGHTAMIFSVRFSPDSRTLATASKDSTVKMWDVPAPKQAMASK